MVGVSGPREVCVDRPVTAAWFDSWSIFRQPGGGPASGSGAKLRRCPFAKVGGASLGTPCYMNRLTSFASSSRDPLTDARLVHARVFPSMHISARPLSEPPHPCRFGAAPTIDG